MLTERPKRHAFSRPLFIVLTILALSVTTLSHQAIAHTMRHLKLLPVSEPVTEIAFTQPTTLPTTYQPNRQFTLPVTVHNDAATAHTYGYRVVQSDETAGTSHLLAEGFLAVDAAQARTFSLSLTPIDLGARSSISVVLDNSPQHTLLLWLSKQ